MHDTTIQLVAPILDAYSLERPYNACLITSGNLHKTYDIKTHAARFILQRISPVFSPQTNLDSHAIGMFLNAHGITTPTLLKTKHDLFWHTDADGFCWRLMNYIEGIVYNCAPSAHVCYEAARLVGRFHTVTENYHPTFHAHRLGVHDTEKHMQHLHDALPAHTHHVAYAKLLPLASAILNTYATLPKLPPETPRLVHGDLKLNNLVFSEEQTAVALIDLDTFAEMPLLLELGDALRSWCNPGSEDIENSQFDRAYFDAAMHGYLETSPKIVHNHVFCENILLAVRTIALELAARFARDTLEESYFGFNQERYEYAWQHHIARARGQFSLMQSIQC